MDGGVRDVVPIYHAWKHGASRVMAIALSPDYPGHLVCKQRYSGRDLRQALALLMRVLCDLLLDEVDDDDLTDARQMAAIGKLVELAEIRHATQEEITAALAPLNPLERKRARRPSRLSELYVHRPKEGTPLETNFRWDRSGMQASIEAGRKAAEDRGPVHPENLIRSHAGLGRDRSWLG
jgi:predicted acylesterase/phospholipase RssA